jgi:hypothetical protein
MDVEYRQKLHIYNQVDQVDPDGSAVVTTASSHLHESMRGWKVSSPCPNIKYK